MRGIELRQLRYFSILATELHFRRAADLAFVTQSALSQQINKLEETIGVPLLTRGRTVQLTPAGVVLRDQLERMFNQLNCAVRKTREAALNRDYRIAIGLVEYTNLPFVPPALMRLQAVYPELSVARHEMDTLKQMEALQRKQIDIGFGVMLAPLPADGSLQAQPVLQSKWTLLMRADHRLARLKKLRTDDLAGERLIIFERSVNTVLYDNLLADCRQHGFTPNFVYQTSQSQVGISLVNQGMGVMLGAAYVFANLPAGMVCREICDMQSLAVHVFSRSDQADPLILEFIGIAVEEGRRSQLAQDASFNRAPPPALSPAPSSGI
ncbi:LysR family transcriptional regulator [Janthinobacterium agaricidamnosum]|uniref:Bacterial regulatory helix-turn-helix, lysR family protein n=1 Tax=Janthinobacterium agaricidamnosum NBRC 102515 = DSM 9628 TaxID=1349767 RepID=W0VCT6_9BURK|nr:LysR family transcriptional regulator [Janthinobacterium agaricidamnosum]CDG85731.1 bacterial regulatory helix-turn-helix, lysR family protein [Janthinobacterium agaricidamnosum NBRC 102515 = DSM 9628]